MQVLFGVHYLAAKHVVATIPPAAWATLRVWGAAAFLLALNAIVHRGQRIPAKDMAKIAFFSLFGVVINQLLFTEGIARTTPAHSALIVTLIPVSTFLFAILLGSERISARKGAGILVSLAGVLVLLRVESLSFRGDWFLGDLFTLLNAFSFGLFLVISRNLARRYPPLTLTAWVMAWGAVGIGICGAGQVVRIDPSTITPEILWIGAWIILFPTVLAYLLNFFALARMESSTVALFIYLQPLIATLLSVGLGREEITRRFILSALLIFGGVYMVARGKAVPHAKVLEAD